MRLIVFWLILSSIQSIFDHRKKYTHETPPAMAYLLRYLIRVNDADIFANQCMLNWRKISLNEIFRSFVNNI